MENTFVAFENMADEQLNQVYVNTLTDIGGLTAELDDRRELVKILRVELAKRQATKEAKEDKPSLGKVSVLP